MPNALSTSKFKSFTLGLLLSSGMEINNFLLFDINFVRLNPPLLHILMKFFTRSLRYQDPQLTLIYHLHKSCFASILSILSTDVLLEA